MKEKKGKRSLHSAHSLGGLRKRERAREKKRDKESDSDRGAHHATVYNVTVPIYMISVI